jgi:thiol-disulfide isomerase/thioredoxin
LKIGPAAWLLSVAVVAAAAGYLSYQRMARPASGLTKIPAPAAAAAPATQPASTSNDTENAANEQKTSPIPEEVPDIALADLKGKRHSLREGSGHARLFNFWATWCEPCRREIPLLNTLQQDHAAEGLEVVGIAVDMRDSVLKFLRTTPMHYTLLVGEDDGFEAAQKFGMALALPFSVFADENNRIIAVKVGELHREEAATILANMRALRAGTTTLAAAREDISQALKSLAIDRAKQSPGS